MSDIGVFWVAKSKRGILRQLFGSRAKALGAVQADDNGVTALNLSFEMEASRQEGGWAVYVHDTLLLDDVFLPEVDRIYTILKAVEENFDFECHHQGFMDYGQADQVLKDKSAHRSYG